MTSAHLDNGVAKNEEGGCSYTVELAKFAEEKLEVDMMDKELEMFKEK